MAELLERPHLVDQHGVPEVQVRRGGVEAGLDAQWLAALQLLQQLGLDQQLGAAALDLGQLFFNRNHSRVPGDF